MSILDEAGADLLRQGLVKNAHRSRPGGGGPLPPFQQFDVRELGMIDYAEAMELQRALVDDRAAGRIGDTLLLLEHPHVITRGRGFNGRTIHAARHPVVDADRGGDATYHGPGQLVGYPIIHLKERGLTVGAHLRRIEDALILALADLGVEAARLKGFTGVWAGGRKIASIGVGVRSWVSYHGFALNVTTDLSQFRGIHPCGLEPEQMTSIERTLAARGEETRRARRRPGMPAARLAVAQAFENVYNAGNACLELTARP